jgi:hypothetical protein
VRRYDRHPGRRDMAGVPLSGVAVVATGHGGSFRTVSTKSGEFTFVKLPLGKYSVRAEVSEILETGPPMNVEVWDPGGCGSIVIAAHYDGRLSGRVTTVHGAPVSRLALELVPQKAEERRAQWMRIQTRTEADGRFEFRAVPPGSYFLAFDGVFFPGVREMSSGKVFDVGPGERVKVPDFVTPADSRIVTVTGRVVDGEGHAIADATITLMDRTGMPDTTKPLLRTDSNGNFTVSLIDGHTYRLYVRHDDVDGRMVPPRTGMVGFTAAAGAALMVTIR